VVTTDPCVAVVGTDGGRARPDDRGLTAPAEPTEETPMTTFYTAEIVAQHQSALRDQAARHRLAKLARTAPSARVPFRIAAPRLVRRRRASLGSV
jgi:hypothetical protein